MTAEFPGSGVASSPGARAGAGSEPSGLLVVGAIGAFACAIVFILAAIQILDPRLIMRTPVLGYAILGLTLCGFIGTGIGFIGYQKTKPNPLALVAGIFFFLTALTAILALVGGLAESRALFRSMAIASPIVQALTLVLAGSVALASKDVFGPGLATTAGSILTAVGAFGLIAFMVRLAGLRSVGALKAIGYTSIALTFIAVAGAVCLGVGFLKMKQSRA